MAKPDDVSDEAWAEAGQLCDAYQITRPAIARAIDAATAKERERCALIADEHSKAKWGGPGDGTQATQTTAKSIAAAIRQGSQPSTSIPVLGTVK